MLGPAVELRSTVPLHHDDAATGVRTRFGCAGTAEAGRTTAGRAAGTGGGCTAAGEASGLMPSPLAGLLL